MKTEDKIRTRIKELEQIIRDMEEDWQSVSARLKQATCKTDVWAYEWRLASLDTVLVRRRAVLNTLRWVLEDGRDKK